MRLLSELVRWLEDHKPSLDPQKNWGEEKSLIHSNWREVNKARLANVKPCGNKNIGNSSSLTSSISCLVDEDVL